MTLNPPWYPAPMKRLVSVDLLAGIGAWLYAVTAHLWVPELGDLVDPTVAVGFGVLALGRWYAAARKVSASDSPKTAPPV